MSDFSVHEAKTHLSRLLRQVEAGEVVTISRGGKPVAHLVPAGETKAPRLLGRDRGLFTVPDDFDAPLPEEVLDAFEGG